MTFNILTLFPGIFSGFLDETIIQRAQDRRLITINLIDIRDYTEDRHRTVDDTPYGGGAGMILKVEPIYRALRDLSVITEEGARNPGHHVAVLSPRGTPFTQHKANEYVKGGNSLTLICGRYEGIDQRVADHLADEEVSVGPYVLSGGEVPAMVIMEATSRLLPNVLGNPDSLKNESFSPATNIEYPQYTKPETFQGWSVPNVLLSGDHQHIKEWRRKHTT